jgi:hypothetical protein
LGSNLSVEFDTSSSISAFDMFLVKHNKTGFTVSPWGIRGGVG